ncbi:hypothetical protein PPERSA_06971 [Pseudocohnilembus persalinus]|uniref:Uncharacterized protein n=1 Tax=Pseudocohnilembus persalinus TaxID=266149 RepID=A0A0V0QYD6_PSEPJ|nr:hypothetical protein PPERSA_06971 [Pseudocohnilembus persalinus]|eukprot:KRX07356.1 hypothetical protein PPERSA_06971 [Pseudocohnilembus persalinus]
MRKDKEIETLKQHQSNEYNSQYNNYSSNFNSIQPQSTEYTMSISSNINSKNSLDSTSNIKAQKYLAQSQNFQKNKTSQKKSYQYQASNLSNNSNNIYNSHSSQQQHKTSYSKQKLSQQQQIQQKKTSHKTSRNTQGTKSGSLSQSSVYGKNYSQSQIMGQKNGGSVVNLNQQSKSKFGSSSQQTHSPKPSSFSSQQNFTNKINISKTSQQKQQQQDEEEKMNNYYNSLQSQNINFQKTNNFQNYQKRNENSQNNLQDLKTISSQNEADDAINGYMQSLMMQDPVPQCVYDDQLEDEKKKQQQQKQNSAQLEQKLDKLKGELQNYTEQEKIRGPQQNNGSKSQAIKQQLQVKIGSLSEQKNSLKIKEQYQNYDS